MQKRKRDTLRPKEVKMKYHFSSSFFSFDLILLEMIAVEWASAGPIFLKREKEKERVRERGREREAHKLYFCRFWDRLNRCIVHAKRSIAA